MFGGRKPPGSPTKKKKSHAHSHSHSSTTGSTISSITTPPPSYHSLQYTPINLTNVRAVRSQSAVELSRPAQYPFSPPAYDDAQHAWATTAPPYDPPRTPTLSTSTSTTNLPRRTPKSPRKSHTTRSPPKSPVESPPQTLSQFMNQALERNAGNPPQDELYDLISSKFDSVITSIDGETFQGDEEELVIHQGQQSGIRGGWGGLRSRELPRSRDRAAPCGIISTNYFAKASLYANSKLPADLPRLKLYFPSYPLLCLAAQYSQRAYNKPTGKEREAYVSADIRMGTKAMVIKSVPVDDMNCVVFAIRGSQTFTDWAVNLNSAPVAPTDFLDDPGNLCHSGFLSVARRMIKPVAARLRALLEEDPSRATCSLLMTGHSAGGAVASLLYAHMLAEVAKSELNVLTGCFKRIHCLTFGTPPISLLPLTKPSSSRHKKSLFMSFINEGDPVPRADKAYVRSLLRLYASPSPGSSGFSTVPLPMVKPCRRPKPKRSNSAPVVSSQDFEWPVPPGTLSNAGRLIALREGKGGPEDVRAEMTTDQDLRGLIWGDPVMHMMKVYARRIELLATRAVTAKIWD